MRKVVIMRGIPGSGKSHICNKLIKDFCDIQYTERKNNPSFKPEQYAIHSADFYFTDEDGYKFDPKKLPEAHNECLREFLVSLHYGVNLIVVDNTNLSTWEVAPYYRVAECKGYEVEIWNVLCPFEVARVRQGHGVPDDKLWQMYQTFHSERLPPHWKVKIIPFGTARMVE